MYYVSVNLVSDKKSLGFIRVLGHTMHTRGVCCGVTSEGVIFSQGRGFTLYTLWGLDKSLVSYTSDILGYTSPPN